MLYVTVRYVCCLCHKIPMRCHWCCCFRYIRSPSLFSLVYFIWSETIYYSIYLEIFVGRRTYKCCVALPVLNIGFMCVLLFVSLCFSRASIFCFLTCRTVEGKRTVSPSLCCGCLRFGKQVLHGEPASPTFSQRGLLCRESDKEIIMRQWPSLPSHSSAFSCLHSVVSLWDLC